MAKPSATIAVIGCGYWGKNLVRNMARLGALAAIADDHADTAQKLAGECSVPARSVDEILADSAIKGVVIASPAVTHAALAKKALEAGKHVFVEKPLALDVKEAQALAELAKQKKRVLMVGHLLHYHPAFIALKKEIAGGRLGKLHTIESRRLSFGKLRTEENVLWSFAPHDFSMVLALAGELPKTVAALAGNHVTPGIIDMAHVQLAFSGDLRAHVMVSWLHPVKEHTLTVIGERGALVFDDTKPWESKLLYYPHVISQKNGVPVAEKKDAVAIALTPAEPLAEECAHFLEAIAGEKVRTDAAEGIRVLSLLHAAQQALLRRREIPLDSDAMDHFVHETAVVDENCDIGEGSRIWHFSHILSGSRLGRQVIVGQNVMIGPDVTIGDGCKIQNNVSLYKGVTLEEGVFCGPSCVFTNVSTPRAEIERKEEFLPTKVGRGATIGANATIVCGNAIGAYSLIGAGAVITKEVKPHALMVGNPARQVGWVSHAGERLGKDMTCPREGRRYKENKGQLEEIGASHAGKRKHRAA